MTAKPTIGVVLCTYNGARYLPTQLESILAQSRAPDLLLACDDGSSDETIEQLQSCAAAARFPFRVIRNAANLGYLRNFEQAIRACDTDVIVLSDQDDAWRPDKLALIESIFAGDEQAGAVFSDAEIVDEEMRFLGYGLLDAVRVNEADRARARAGQAFPVLLRRNIVCGATMALRATWKERVLPFPDGAIHDEWISLIIAAHNGLRFIAQPLIRYRQHATNQIGLIRPGWRRRVDSFLHRQGPENRRRLVLMRNLRERLSGLGAPATVLEEVEGKIIHMQCRLSLPKAPFARASAIAGEITAERYSRYSSGWLSAARDLVLPM